MSELKNPSVLAFEAKLACSDAIMFAGNWDNRDKAGFWTPIRVNEKSVRGTISNRLKGAKASKIDAEVETPNLQTVDNAALNFDTDTLKLTFSLRILGNLRLPSICNNPEYQKKLGDKITAYIDQEGFTELATRYALNLANGRFLWRNRVGAEQIAVHITNQEYHECFDAQHYPLRDFDKRDNSIVSLAHIIEQGLMGKKPTLLTIESYIQLGEGQTVYPSQELVMNSKDKKSKYLYQLSGQAAMHSQKIGNALRTIDTWYPSAVEDGPIAIEPYGSVTNRGIAYRKPENKNDFYTLLDGWILKDKTPKSVELHYIIAMLIRGGVFGE